MSSEVAAQAAVCPVSCAATTNPPAYNQRPNSSAASSKLVIALAIATQQAIKNAPISKTLKPKPNLFITSTSFIIRAILFLLRTVREHTQRKTNKGPGNHPESVQDRLGKEKRSILGVVSENGK